MDGSKGKALPRKRRTKKERKQPAWDALVIRTCKADGTSHGGFRWPESGYVEAPDWTTEPVCQGGLFGLLDGVGNYKRLSSNADAIWQIVRVVRAECIEVEGEKVKFPRGRVIYSGPFHGALTRISAEWIRIAVEKNGAHSATTGNGAHSATNNGVAACLGVGGQAKSTAGALVLAWEDAAGRCRVTVGYVGEDGIEADIPYRCDENGRLVKVEG